MSDTGDDINPRRGPMGRDGGIVGIGPEKVGGLGMDMTVSR